MIQDQIQGVMIPYIPAPLWILAAALTMAVLIIMFLYQLHWRNREAALLKDHDSVASLSAEISQKQADRDALTNWIREQQNDLLRLTADREQQERVRAELTDLEQRCLVKDQENEFLRKEVGGLENQRYMLGQTLERIRAEIGDLEGRRGEAEGLERRIEELQASVDDAKAILSQMAEAEIRFEALSREKLALEISIPEIRSEFEATRQALDKMRTDLEIVKSAYEHAERENAGVRAERSQLDVMISALRFEQNTLEKSVTELRLDAETTRNEGLKAQEKLTVTLADLAGIRSEFEATRQALDKALTALEMAKSEYEHAERESAGVRAERSQLDDMILALRTEQNTLETSITTMRSDAEIAKDEGLKAQEKLVSIFSELGEMRKERVQLEVMIPSLRQEHNNLEREARLAHSEAVSARDEMKKLHDALDAVKANHEEALQEISDSRRERSQNEVLVSSLRSEQNFLEKDVARLEEAIKGLEGDRDEMKEVVKEEKMEVVRLQREMERARTQLESVICQKEEVESAEQRLLSRKNALEIEIERLEGRKPEDEGEGADLRPYADLLEKAPACLVESEFTRQWEDDEEYTALERFKEHLLDRKLRFSPRVVDAFHTSLKCQDINPLTVLAGVSGTGKTLLPMKYAELMGLHSLVMSVQPRWDSPQDLFGFYNYLEKEYKATDLSRSLVLMDPYNYSPKKFPSIDGAWARKRMLLVLLDEMNLARTEYYFSEFLSKLELRRQVENPDNSSDREKAEIDLDAGPSKSLRFRLWTPKNVLFVGTMNEDETTQTLSDKVLDRANVLRFGKPDDRPANVPGDDQERKKPQRFISFEQWEKWHRKSDGTEPWSAELDKWVRELNDGLNMIGRPFGYRVQDAIAQYVINYPQVGEDDRYKFAFADQVEQKIIPKLRGMEIGDSNSAQCLQSVESIIDILGDTELSQAFASSMEESRGLGMFTWRGVTRKIA